jgi:hypothetical protein
MGIASTIPVLGACKNNNNVPMVDAGPDAPAGCTQSDASVDIGMNHFHAPHALVVPMADVQAAVEKVYDIMGVATHTHTITVTADDFNMLKMGGTIMKTSTPFDFDGHTHVITISCG